MFSSIFNFLLAAGFLASAASTHPQSASTLKVLTKKDLDLALTPLPGIEFSKPTPKFQKSAAEKRAKDRFQATEHWTPLHAYKGPRSGHMSATNTLGRVQRKYGGSGYENITSTSAYGTQYGVDVKFNNQRLTLALDTGSSDTWAVSSKANCTGYMYLSSCFFGPSYAGGFDKKTVSDEHLYIKYGDGEVVQGPIGMMNVTVGGIRVINQTVALANDTFWNGNNVTSGILGLAYPSITNAYVGPFGEHSPWYQMEYSPIFSNMVAQGLVDNHFSIAISRDASDGVLGLGGVPEHLNGVDYDSLAMTDIIIVSFNLLLFSDRADMLRPTWWMRTPRLQTTHSTPSSQMAGSLALPPMTERCHTSSTLVLRWHTFHKVSRSLICLTYRSNGRTYTDS